jgi:threonine synthase
MSEKSAQYISTRGGIVPVNFCDAVMMGLADDGGLILPVDIPPAGDLGDLARLPYRDLALAVMRPFIGDAIPEADLKSLIDRSYDTFRHPEITPVVAVDDLHILELFHGPTLAFKDVALQFLGNLFEYILERRNTELNILGATSGDTGSAAIYGVRGKDRIRIFIMHPHNRVSPIQERQMTTVLDDNVHNIAIQGTFDDGQRILKEIFGDIEFKSGHHLGAVNSVNWARVLAQIVYYFYGAFRMQETTGADTVQVAVPTGNFGDIFAGYLAKRMGAPISRLVLAANDNDILSRFFNTGTYELDTVVETLSPSMDIQVASNFERYLYYRLGQDAKAVKDAMQAFARTGKLVVAGEDPEFVAGSGSVQDTLDTIRDIHESTGYLLDPHTAVGVAVARQNKLPDSPTLCLATAHPAKFPDAIIKATGKNLAHHPEIDGILDLETRCEILPAEKPAVMEFMRNIIETEI